MATSILLVDDHTLFRRGLHALLEREEDLEVVGEASDGLQAVEQALRLSPDIVVMDLWMPGLSGLEAAKRILEQGKPRILIVSMYESRSYVDSALRVGACGYVGKSGPPSHVVRAIEAIAAGGTYLSPTIAQGSDNSASSCESAALRQLTGREQQVLGFIAEGLSSREIATRCEISLSTVVTHRSSLMRKLGVHKVAGLVRLAIREGVVPP